jgi:hypothetical protein
MLPFRLYVKRGILNLAPHSKPKLFQWPKELTEHNIYRLPGALHGSRERDRRRPVQPTNSFCHTAAAIVSVAPVKNLFKLMIHCQLLAVCHSIFIFTVHVSLRPIPGELILRIIKSCPAQRRIRVIVFKRRGVLPDLDIVGIPHFSAHFDPYRGPG